MYVHVCVCMCMYVYVSTYVSACVCMCMYLYVCMYVCVYAYVCMCTCMRIGICMSLRIRIGIGICIYNLKQSRGPPSEIYLRSLQLLFPGVQVRIGLWGTSHTYALSPNPNPTRNPSTRGFRRLEYLFRATHRNPCAHLICFYLGSLGKQ